MKGVWGWGNVKTYLLVKERFGEGQPALDSHYDGHATGTETEEPPQHAEPTRPHVVAGLRPRARHGQLDQHAGQRYAIVGGQAPQHETVFLVAAGPGPVEYEQRQQVAEYAEHVRGRRAHEDFQRRRRRRRRGRVGHGGLHRGAVAFCRRETGGPIVAATAADAGDFRGGGSALPSNAPRVCTCDATAALSRESPPRDNAARC